MSIDALLEHNKFQNHILMQIALTLRLSYCHFHAIVMEHLELLH